MLGSKAFDPSDTGLLCTTCSRNPQKHSQFAHFSLKNGYLLILLQASLRRTSDLLTLVSETYWGKIEKGRKRN